MEVKKISEAIEEAIIKSRKLKEGIISGYWSKIVDKLSGKSQPLWIKDHILYVLVEDSVYLHYMSMNKNKYLKKIEKILNSNYVIDLRFKISKIKLMDFSDDLKQEQNIEIKQDFISNIKNLSIEEQIDILKKKSLEREEALKIQGYKKCNMCGMMILGEEKICKFCSLKNITEDILEEKNDSK